MNLIGPDVTKRDEGPGSRLSAKKTKSKSVQPKSSSRGGDVVKMAKAQNELVCDRKYDAESRDGDCTACLYLWHEPTGTRTRRMRRMTWP